MRQWGKTIRHELCVWGAGCWEGRWERWAHLCNYTGKKEHWISFCDEIFLRFMTSNVISFLKDGFDVLCLNCMVVSQMCIYIYTYIFSKLIKMYTCVHKCNVQYLCFIIFKLCLNIFLKMPFPVIWKFVYNWIETLKAGWPDFSS